MEFKPDWEPAEELLSTTQVAKTILVPAVPRFSIAESVSNDESHQNNSTRMQSSKLDHIVSQQGGNCSNHAAISHDDREHAVGIDTDTSLNDQDSVIYQRQLPAGNNSDFMECTIALKVDIQNSKWHQDTVVIKSTIALKVDIQNSKWHQDTVELLYEPALFTRYEHSIHVGNGSAYVGNGSAYGSSSFIRSSSSSCSSSSFIRSSSSSCSSSSFIHELLILGSSCSSSSFIRSSSSISSFIRSSSSIIKRILLIPPESQHESSARTFRIRLLKQYGFVKKELNWPDIISIAHDLHDDGYIEQHEMEQIKDGSQSRRKAIDTLLKIVLRNPSTVSAFMRILESKRHLLYIAERINKTKIFAEEMERFHFQEGTLQRQSIYQEPSQKFHFSNSDVDLLIHNLIEEEEVIDQISDALLSKFYISIHDHSKLSNCAYLDDKIHRLLDLMKKYPDSALDIFFEVLTENNLQHVLDSLELNQMVNIKRKYSFCDDESPPAKKYMKINHNQKLSTSDAVEKIASGLRNATTRQMLRNKAIQHLDLEFNEAFSGSLGLMLSFKVGEPSQKLK